MSQMAPEGNRREGISGGRGGYRRDGGAVRGRDGGAIGGRDAGIGFGVGSMTVAGILGRLGLNLRGDGGRRRGSCVPAKGRGRDVANPVRSGSHGDGIYGRIGRSCDGACRRVCDGDCGRVCRWGCGVRRLRRTACDGLEAAPGLAESHPLANVVEAEGVGQGKAVAACDRGVIGLEYHVEPPAHREETKDAVVIGERHEHGEDGEMHNALGKLAVIHGPYAGNDAEQRCEHRAGIAGGEWLGRNGGVRGNGCVSRCRGGGAHAGGEAWLAEDASPYGPQGRLGERAPTVLAESHAGGVALGFALGIAARRTCRAPVICSACVVVHGGHVFLYRCPAGDTLFSSSLRISFSRDST